MAFREAAAYYWRARRCAPLRAEAEPPVAVAMLNDVHSD